MKEEGRMPEIRFDGYKSKWCKCRLGEIVEVCSGRDYKHLSEGNIPVYGTGGYMLSVDEALSYNKDAVGIGRKGTIDQPYLLRAPFWTVDTLFYVFPKDGFDLNFVYDIFQNVDWKKEDESTGVPSLSKLAINRVEVLFPQYKEQIKIGDFLGELDKFICHQQSKYDHLVNMKSTLLAKMFPHDGAKVPEIRFSGFTKEWEKRKVKDIAPLQRGFDLPKEVMEDGAYPVVMSNGISGYHSQYKVKAPGVVTGRSGTIGALHYIEKNFWPHNTTLWVTDFKGNYPLFVYYMYQNLKLDRFQAGSGVPTLNRNDVHDIVMSVPQLDEQKEIAIFLKNFDSLITIQQHKINQLQNIKQLFLDKIFVS